MFHGLYFITSEASGFRGHTRLEGFVLSPDCAVEDLEGCLFSLGWEQRYGQYFVGIEESVPPWEHQTISLTSQV